jgi:uncharacterized protein (DUF1800 family)
MPMPVSTTQRRTFLQQLTGKAPAKPIRLGKLATAKLLAPFQAQELPEVPSAAHKFTFNSGLTPYTGPWGRVQAAHLLRRTGFGVKKTDLDQLAGLNMMDAVAQVLTPAAAPPPHPVNNYNNPDFTDPAVPAGETWVNATFDGDSEGYRLESWRGWWFDRMLAQEGGITERLTLFWHNHFSTQTEIVYWGRSMYEQNAKLRANCLGNFKEMVKLITIDSAMLIYLNGYLNQAGAPDENYARELQELFTVGKDNPDHYTEDDVVAAARVLTGWTINFPSTESFNYAVAHDFGDKQFSAFYNNTVITGTPLAEQELDAMLDMIFAKNEVSEHICRKLYRWFVYYDITPTVEINVIQPLATIFRDNNYEIKPVLKALLESEHFFEAAQSGCFVKTPVDIALGTMRSFNTTFTGTTPLDSFQLQYYMSYYLAEMRMRPGDPPNVAGWQPFRQVPQYYRLWINGDTIRMRNLFTDIMIAYYLETDNDRLNFDILAFAAQFNDPANPNTLVDNILELLVPQALSPLKKIVLKSILLSGLPNDSYWTDAWTSYVNNPGDDMAKEVVYTRLRNLLLYMTRLPEFQLA